MFKYSTKILTLLIALVMCLATASAYAVWTYASEPTNSTQNALSLGGIPFKYAPSQILPGDQDSTDLHSNHLNLIGNIVNHIDYGLNATKKPIIREMLEEGAGVVYSGQNVQGGNLKHMLVNTSDVDALAFVVQYSTATEFIAYTFCENDANGDNLGDYIEVYKTVIEKKNTKWEATLSYKGEAKVFDPGIVSYSIDVTTWKSATQAS